jgi:hypothetical protein
MSDYYSIQDVGGTKLARHYPDRELQANPDYHRALLIARQRAEGWRRWFAKSEKFLALLSRDKDGLRLLVSLNKFATCIPWSEMAVLGERCTPATRVRLQTAAVPSLDLEFYLDDAAADTLFQGVMAPLPYRDPPGRIYWPKPGAIGILIGLMLTTAIGLALLRLSWFVQVAVAVVLCVGISAFWHVCRPVFEEERPVPIARKPKDS